jgi:hypothetical protein
MLPAVSVKETEVDPAATVAEAGAASSELSLDKLTVRPPAGAAFVRLTTQPAEPFGVRVAGLHESEESAAGNAGADKVTVAVFDAPPAVAVTVTD